MSFFKKIFSSEKKETLDKGLEKSKSSFLGKLSKAVAGKSQVDDEVLVGRLLERGKTSGRKDDADESIIRNRIKEYYKKTAILKDYYSAQDKYYGVDGVGSISEITERLNAVIDNL